MNQLTYTCLNNFVTKFHEYLETNYRELIDLCCKLDNFDELKDVMKNLSITLNYEYILLLYVFDGEVPEHPIYKMRIEELGLYCIKNSVIKERQFMKKDVTFDDLFNLLKVKNNTISFLRQRLDTPKISSGLVEPLIDTKPHLSSPRTLGDTRTSPVSFENKSSCSSPTSLIPGMPQNPFEYNPFVMNVWK
jgi:hypothetical protein